MCVQEQLSVGIGCETSEKMRSGERGDEEEEGIIGIKSMRAKRRQCRVEE